MPVYSYDIYQPKIITAIAGAGCAPAEMLRSKSPVCPGAPNKLRQAVQAFHQAALAAGSVILMNDALRGSFIQRLNGLCDGDLGCLTFPGHDRGFCLRNKRARGAAVNAVAQAALFILLIALNRRLNVSQSPSSKTRSRSYDCEERFYPKPVILSRPILNLTSLASASHRQKRRRRYVLPAPHDQSTMDYRSFSAATPGSSRPSSISSDAPPPVEMCVIWPARPDC